MKSIEAQYYLADLEPSYQAILDEFDQTHIGFKVWGRDRDLFKTTDSVMLDWLFGPSDVLASLDELKAMEARVRAGKYSSVVLLGMGGSSLAPLVFKTIFAKHMPFFILDTIHPESIRRIAEQIDVATTLFIVASKSGTTLESNLLYRYFWHVLKAQGVEAVAENFMAITDPKTPLRQESLAQGFLPGPMGKPNIGGRFSAFSAFGMMPAMLLGLDVERLLKSAQHMADACGPSMMARNNPGALLGAFLAACAENNRDRLAIYLDHTLLPLGLWFEQLIAESLGKEGGGLVPILAKPHQRFHNSASIYIYFGEKNNSAYTDNTSPSVRISMADLYDISGVMYQFQMAVALAGAALGVNPFDQPNVEHSKRHTRAMIDNLSQVSPQVPGQVPSSPKVEQDNFFADMTLKEFLSSVEPNDYVAILSFLDERDDIHQYLEKLSTKISHKTGVPVLIQCGPRYLHSTGQLFKGGRNNGKFLFITGPYEHDLVSEDQIKFSAIHMSQALGDIHALRENGRTVCQVHLHQVDTGFTSMIQAICSEPNRNVF